MFAASIFWGCAPPAAAGKSTEAQVKLAAQKRVLGNTCPILSCASLNAKSYCTRDCAQFPCDNFRGSSYPYSQAYLDMQQRRRQEWVPRTDPLGKPIDIPQEYWDTLSKRDLKQVATVTLAEVDDAGNLVFPFLGIPLVLDLMSRQLCIRDNGKDMPLDVPLLTLTVLIYFKTVDRLYPMGRDLISTKDMKGAGYFSGDHTLRKEPMIRRFNRDSHGFDMAAAALDGRSLDMADTAWVFHPFPRVPVYYLFWDLDTEYEPRLSILFDRSIQDIFGLPMIWELVNLVNARLLSV